MIIRFEVENWMSFRNRVTLSMIAGREFHHEDRVSRIDKYRLGVLPIAAIYGGNASGKTNLFTALSFMKRLVVRGTRPDSPIPVNRFCLDNQSSEVPARFLIEMLVGEDIYAFSFAVTRQSVIEEKLVRVSSSSERLLYDRKAAQPMIFDSSLPEMERLEFAFKGTRSNQLFLTNAVSQNVDTFKPVHDWFNNTLTLIAPDSRFESFYQFVDEGEPLYSAINDALSRLDTGIVHLGGEEIPLENLPIPESDKARMQEEVKEDTAVCIVVVPVNERYVITKKDGTLVAKKLVTYHAKSDGTEEKFEMRQESDGSKRLIDILPAFLDMSTGKTNKVYIVDELDRSLHTLLTRNLLELYLSTCSANSRAQLLFTTHDVLLMDQQLFRRDEMWVTERAADGVTNLQSFSEYKDVRADKNIRKSYLQGRLGGIPRILLGNPCISPRDHKENEGDKR